MNILLIDDDPAVCSVYACALRSAGFEVWTAQSGQEGLKAAVEVLPELILCDYNLPDTTGDHLLGEFRAKPGLQRSQIIMITGHPEICGNRERMNCGADDFLVKPIAAEELLSCVGTRLEWVRQCLDAGTALDGEKIRREFRACLSHVFYTPLNGILGMAQLLRAELGSAGDIGIAEILNDLECSGWRLQRALRNYLFLLDSEGCTKADKMKGNPDSDTISAAVLQGAETAVERHGRGTDLDIQIGECTFCCDADGLSIVVEELVDNACSYSSPGTPVRVWLTHAGVLSVADSGDGIDAASLDRISRCLPFIQNDSSGGGLGIGLFIVRKLLHRFGASISFSSRGGAGTTVTVRFLNAPLTFRDPIK